MADHWTFVFGAYALAAAVLLGYWRGVERRIRALRASPEERSEP